jgi:hypothetical protein
VPLLSARLSLRQHASATLRKDMAGDDAIGASSLAINSVRRRRAAVIIGLAQA